MIKIIVFSYNRAMQLQALLESIQQFWKVYSYSVDVIYNTSNQEFEKGYDILKNLYDAQWLKESTLNRKGYGYTGFRSIYNLRKRLKYPNLRKQKTNFRELVLKLLDDSHYDYVMFLTDDSIFIRNVEIPDLGFIHENPEQTSLSLRLGGEIIPQPNNLIKKDGLLQWNYHVHQQLKNWGYPFSVDAHIYSRLFIKILLSRIIFNNPSTLEDMVCNYVKSHKFLSDGYSLDHSCILSFPMNMVQSVANNESQNLSVEMLNQRFIDGWKLQYVFPKNYSTFQQYPEAVLLSRDEEKEELQLNRPDFKN